VASQAASSRHLRCGAAATIGWRQYMEDTLVLEPAWLPQRRLGLLAVFDGHGGAESARFCAHHLVGGAAGSLPGELSCAAGGVDGAAAASTPRQLPSN
jgi:serine/threonine protein phosphatase PrpC